MKIMKYILFVLISLGSVSNLQAENRERVYLQTDKQLYLVGESMWLKLTTTTQDGIPMVLSKVGYVELLDDKEVYQQEKIEIKGCIGSGRIEIPVDLPTGTYRLIAYTRYMLNEEASVFFEKQIGIVNPYQKITLRKTNEEGQPTHSISDQTVKNTVSLSTDKANYSVRASGIISLRNIPEDVVSLSVSVTGTDLVAFNVSSGIVDWINQLRKIANASFSGTILPEYEGHIISGKIIDVETGHPVVNKDVVPLLAVPGSDISLFGGKMDDEGNVSFVTGRMNGSSQVATAVSNPINDKQYRIDLQSPFVSHSSKSLEKLEIKPEYQESILKRSVGLQSLYAYSPEKLNQFIPISPFFQWKPDNSYVLEHYNRFSTMEDVVTEIVAFLKYRRIAGRRIFAISSEDGVGYAMGNTLVLIDGVPVMDHESIFTYNPEHVKQIDLYRSKFVFAGTYYNGMANFQTIKNDLADYKFDASTQLLNYKSPQPPAYFYAPDYQKAAVKAARLPDFRHTLLWNPDVKTNGEQSIDIPFVTSDYTGEFIVKIEGLTVAGKLVFAECKFTVE